LRKENKCFGFLPAFKHRASLVETSNSLLRNKALSSTFFSVQNSPFGTLETNSYHERKSETTKQQQNNKKTNLEKRPYGQHIVAPLELHKC
jgi:hypothetical protein